MNNSKTSPINSFKRCNKKVYYMDAERLNQLHVFDDCPPYDHLTKIDLNINASYTLKSNKYNDIIS